MSDEFQKQLCERLERLPYADAPPPWRIAGGAGIGGLTEVGFADGTDDLLVVSSQGRGLFDCLTGERIARDCEEMFENDDESGMTAPGIGKHANTIFRLAGLQGGGLSLFTRDGWGIHVVQLPWPIHVVFLTSEYKGLTDDTGHITKLCNDEPCSYRAAGFSPTGRSFVVATSGELTIYTRDVA
jgi:hypothetical protein